MIGLLLASHDPLDHVLPHRFTEPLWRFPWTVTDPFGLNIFRIDPHNFYFTNQLLMTLVAAAILLIFFPILGRRYAAMQNRLPEDRVPTGVANLIEAMMQFIRNDVARPVLADKTDRFMPFLWTVFFYILLCNLLGMIPLDSIIYLLSGRKLQHIGGTATGNIMITAGLATCSFLMIHFSGTQQIFRDLVAGTYGHHHHREDHHETHDLHGGGHEYGLAHGDAADHVDHRPRGMAAPAAAMAAPFLYLWNFAPHVFKPEKVTGLGSMLLMVADIGMWAFLLVLEFIGALIKPFALAIRLFANMVAGHVVLASILALIFLFKGSVAANTGVGIISALGSAALSMLELFVAFLQAYVFTFLTTLFIGASVAPEH
ncbi:MAG TPA: F0F1 ATP synthase subunit A [Phycisphaerae bacterium]|nr:F0F1 ATP synthase subunit A [Phycisphaerae bacterium]